MKKRIVILGVILTLVVALSACSTNSNNAKAQNVQNQGQTLTAQAFAAQEAAVPYPASSLTNSQERTNLRKRLLIQNDPNHIGYVYILNFGKIVGYYVIKGKVSSNASQMTPSTFVEHHADTGGGNVTYEAPGDDGSYGPSEAGIFFFTTNGVLVQTDSNYLYADAPIAVGNIPQLAK